MFWTDWGSNAKIERANMDGSNRTVLVNSTIMSSLGLGAKIVWPNGLAIDYDTDTIYWVDANSDIMATMDLNGGNICFLKGSEVQKCNVSVYYFFCKYNATCQ